MTNFEHIVFGGMKEMNRKIEDFATQTTGYITHLDKNTGYEHTDYINTLTGDTDTDVNIVIKHAIDWLKSEHNI